MSDRGTVDPTRQGGESIASKRAAGSPPVSAVEGKAYFDRQRWRKVRSAALQAGLALIDEVECLCAELMARRIDGEVAAVFEGVAEIERLRAESLRYEIMATGYKLELDEVRAAVSEIIGCAYGDGLACRRDNYGFHGCCLARLRAARLGIGVVNELAEELEDGS